MVHGRQDFRGERYKRKAPFQFGFLQDDVALIVPFPHDVLPLAFAFDSKVPGTSMAYLDGRVHPGLHGLSEHVQSPHLLREPFQIGRGGRCRGCLLMSPERCPMPSFFFFFFLRRILRVPEQVLLSLGSQVFLFCFQHVLSRVEGKNEFDWFKWLSRHSFSVNIVFRERFRESDFEVITY